MANWKERKVEKTNVITFLVVFGKGVSSPDISLYLQYLYIVILYLQDDIGTFYSLFVNHIMVFNLKNFIFFLLFSVLITLCRSLSGKIIQWRL